MKIDLTLGSVFQGLLTLWKAMHDLQKVERWTPFHEVVPGLPRQSTLAHTHAAQSVLAYVAIRLKDTFPFDFAFLMQAVFIHDLGELKDGDKIYMFKTDSDDLKEYLTFRKIMEQSGEGFLELYHQAYLLQYVGKKSVELFPEDAQREVKWLAENRPNDARVFNMVERLDYLVYPLVHFHETTTLKRLGSRGVLIEVLGNQIPYFEHYMKEIPGFDRIISPEQLASLKVFHTQYKADDAGPLVRELKKTLFDLLPVAA